MNGEPEQLAERIKKCDTASTALAAMTAFNTTLNRTRRADWIGMFVVLVALCAYDHFSSQLRWARHEQDHLIIKSKVERLERQFKHLRDQP